MSVQFSVMKSRHACRESSPLATVHPAGTSANAGHKECCPSSLTSTRKVPSGFSNGLVMSGPLGWSFRERRQPGREHPADLGQRARVHHARMVAVDDVVLDGAVD